MGAARDVDGPAVGRVLDALWTKVRALRRTRRRPALSPCRGPAAVGDLPQAGAAHGLGPRRDAVRAPRRRDPERVGAEAGLRGQPRLRNVQQRLERLRSAPSPTHAGGEA